MNEAQAMREWRTILASMAFRYRMPQDADDLFQRWCLQVWQYRDRLAELPRDEARPYCFAIARSVLNEAANRRKRRAEVAIEATMSTKPNGDQRLLERRALLGGLLAKLNPRDREAVDARLKGEPWEEIAKRLGVETNTLTANILRKLKKLVNGRN
jgi:RNA polymerase sigma factor (sigma-70 family)